VKSLIIALFLLGLPELRMKAVFKMVPSHDAKILQFHNKIWRSKQRLRNQFADAVYINYATTYHANFNILLMVHLNIITVFLYKHDA
jgi:hypothetical protein